MVSSSLFYAMRNPIDLQNRIVQNESLERPEPSLRTESQELLPKRNQKVKTKAPSYIFTPLTSFDPDYKEIDSGLGKSNLKKENRKSSERKSQKISQTKLLLELELKNAEQRLDSKIGSKSPKEKTAQRKKPLKKELRKKHEKDYTPLDVYVGEKKISISEVSSSQAIETEEITPKQTSKINRSEENSHENAPFAFTTLSEWLIWHTNFPELSHVREAYSLDDVPEGSEVEVFWVNILDEPAFFNPDWRIAGSRIYDKTSLKNRNFSPGEPEWDIMSTLTDGFSLYFEDVWRIVANTKQGIVNYRYPVLQLALRGLLLLDLMEFREDRWYSKGSFSELKSRIRELDLFIAAQQSPTDFSRRLGDEYPAESDWYIGMIAFDLFIMNSSFIRAFIQNHNLSELEKVETIKKQNLSNPVIKMLNKLESFDSRRVTLLSRYLEPN